MGKPVQFAQDDDPPPRKRVIPIQRVGAADRLRILCLSPKIQGFQFHWDDGETKPCTVGEELCKRCLKKVPKKWYGFLHGLLQPQSKPVFVQLTQFAWDGLKLLSKDLADLRGVELGVERERASIRAPIRCWISSLLWIDKAWPKEQSVVPTLRKLFTLEDED